MVSFVKAVFDAAIVPGDTDVTIGAGVLVLKVTAPPAVVPVTLLATRRAQ